MNGKVIIKTELDTKGLEKGLKNAQKKLEQLEKENEKLTLQKSDAEANLSPYKNEIKELQEMIEKSEKLNLSEKQRRFEDETHQQILDNINNKYSEQISAYNEISDKVKQNILEQQNVKSNIEQINQKLNQTGPYDNINDKLKNIGNSVEKITKKVVHWGLAIFGIRTAYNAIRSAMSTITSQDEQLATDIEYMKNALAFTLEPVIRGIVNLMKQLMFYVAYVVKAWTGRDIFANANKSLKKANGEAKKLSKTLAGFDEMNILNSSSTGGGGGVSTPSFDLGKPEDYPIPSWLQWIVDNKDIVIAGLAGIGAGLLSIYFGLSLIKGLGIGIAVFFIVKLIEDIIKLLNDPTFENFTNVLIDIAGAVTGVAIAFGAWPVAIGAVIALIVLLIVQNFDKIMSLFDKFTTWIDTAFREKMRLLFGPIGDYLTDGILSAVTMVKSLFKDLFGGIKQIVEGIIKIFKGDFKGGISQVFSGLKSIMLAPVNALISGLNVMIRGINRISFDTPDWVPVIGGKKWGFNIPEIPRLALAKGAIASYPGRGIPTPSGNATWAEAGAEAYLPLTDEQVMDTLGQSIARHMVVNLTNITELDGRQIARKVDKIQQNNNFVLNR